jgi:hypothetical protein
VRQGVGREDAVELDRLGLVEERLGVLIRGPLRIFHDFSQATQSVTGQFGMAQAVPGKGEEGQIGRFLLLVPVV